MFGLTRSMIMISSSSKAAIGSGGQQRNSSGSFFQSYNVDGLAKQMNTSLKKASAMQKVWKRVTIFVCAPAILFAMGLAYADHQAQHHAHKQADFIPYHYIAVRNRPFPWGDGNHTLFHNKKHNYVPGVGFEEEEEDEH